MIQNQFVVWSVTRSERLIEVECGGGHRTWGYTVKDVASESVATFACVKAQQVFIHQVPWQLGSRQSIIKVRFSPHHLVVNERDMDTNMRDKESK